MEYLSSITQNEVPCTTLQITFPPSNLKHNPEDVDLLTFLFIRLSLYVKIGNQSPLVRTPIDPTVSRTESSSTP